MVYCYEKSKTSELKLFVGLLCCSKVLVKSCYFSVFFCNVDTQKVFFSLGSLLLTVRKSPNVEKTNYFQYAASCRYVPLPTHCVDVEDGENKVHSGLKYKEILSLNFYLTSK